MIDLVPVYRWHLTLNIVILNRTHCANYVLYYFSKENKIWTSKTVYIRHCVKITICMSKIEYRYHLTYSTRMNNHLKEGGYGLYMLFPNFDSKKYTSICLHIPCSPFNRNNHLKQGRGKKHFFLKPSSLIFLGFIGFLVVLSIGFFASFNVSYIT